MLNEFADLILWGPKASGKTSFLGAFAKTLSYISVNNLKHDYRLFWYDPNAAGPYSTSLPNWNHEVSPNWSSEYEESTDTNTQGHKRYEFQCLSRENNTVLDRYKIGAFDAGGDDLLSAVNPNSQYVDPIVRAYIDSSNSIIAIFDLEELINNDASRQSNLEALRNLLHYVSSTHGSNADGGNVNLAICMNKIDLIDLRWENPEIIYHIAFKEPLQNLERYYRGKLNVKVFASSVMGFFEHNFSEYSNYNRDKRRPRFVDVWTPWNVHAPFFWIFEQWSRNKNQDTRQWLRSFLRQNENKSFYFRPFF